MAAETAPLLALAGLILVKESGVPIPVPGDLVVLGAGVAASSGNLDGATTLLALVLASVIGGVIQFGLLRSIARPATLALLARLGLADRIAVQTERLRRGGARGVAITRVTPGVRIVAIAASAIAGVPLPAFLGGLIVGNGLFIAAHFALGYGIGTPVLAVVGGALGAVAALGLVLAVVGAVGWVLVTRRGGRHGEPGSVLAWADASCPACLTLAAMGDLPLGGSVAST